MTSTPAGARLCDLPDADAAAGLPTVHGRTQRTPASRRAACEARAATSLLQDTARSSKRPSSRRTIVQASCTGTPFASKASTTFESSAPGLRITRLGARVAMPAANGSMRSRLCPMSVTASSDSVATSRRPAGAARDLPSHCGMAPRLGCVSTPPDVHEAACIQPNRGAGRFAYASPGASAPASGQQCLRQVKLARTQCTHWTIEEGAIRAMDASRWSSPRPSQGVR